MKFLVVITCTLTCCFYFGTYVRFVYVSIFRCILNPPSHYTAVARDCVKFLDKSITGDAPRKLSLCLSKHHAMKA
jgi:hypothetical protein